MQKILMVVASLLLLSACMTSGASKGRNYTFKHAVSKRAYTYYCKQGANIDSRAKMAHHYFSNVAYNTSKVEANKLVMKLFKRKTSKRTRERMVSRFITGMGKVGINANKYLIKKYGCVLTSSKKM